MPLSVALVCERRPDERRVALVPVAVRRLLAVPGLRVRVERGCGRTAGFRDADYTDVDASVDGGGGRVSLVANFAAAVAGADIVVKVDMPTVEEIAGLAAGTVLVTLTRAFLHLEEVAALAAGGITTIAMDLMPRTARARSMDAVASQATVAGYKAALLAAALSPRLFPMLTTAAGTIRPSRVVVIGAGVAGLQVIATLRRLGAEVEAYDIRRPASERIESLGARVIDTGVEATDAAGHARALRRDERRRQHDVLAERLARAHAVVCAASIPHRSAPCIVTADMVEGMLADTVIVDMAAATGGNCELTRPGEHVRHGDTLIAGPLNLPSHGAVHASEMYARNVTNLLGLVIGADGELALDGDDDILARCVLTHAGELCHAPTAALLARPARAFGHPAERGPDEGPDVESDWPGEAPGPLEAVGAVGAVGVVGAAPAGETAREERSEPGDAGRAGGADGRLASEGGRRAGGGGITDAGTPVSDPSPDDLTVVDGIGPALQGRLYAFGVTRLSMLAALDDDGRQRLAVQLELDDEIEREDWVGQARRLTTAHERVGERDP